jgi:hypothetical protein
LFRRLDFDVVDLVLETVEVLDALVGGDRSLARFEVVGVKAGVARDLVLIPTGL